MERDVYAVVWFWFWWSLGSITNDATNDGSGCGADKGSCAAKDVGTESVSILAFKPSKDHQKRPQIKNTPTVKL